MNVGSGKQEGDHQDTEDFAKDSAIRVICGTHIGLPGNLNMTLQCPKTCCAVTHVIIRPAVTHCIYL